MSSDVQVILKSKSLMKIVGILKTGYLTYKL
jgi:hypothetical protein